MSVGTPGFAALALVLGATEDELPAIWRRVAEADHGLNPTPSTPTAAIDEVRAALTAVRGEAAKPKPRVIEMPEEDRTRKWTDSSGSIWQPMYQKTWWISLTRRNAPPEQWHEMLVRGPLTDAGPA